MAEPKKKESPDDWENLKALGFEVEAITLWQAAELFGKAEKTISPMKFPGAKFFWTPSGCLMEYQKRREIIPQAGIMKVKCF